MGGAHQQQLTCALTSQNLLHKFLVTKVAGVSFKIACPMSESHLGFQPFLKMVSKESKDAEDVDDAYDICLVRQVHGCVPECLEVGSDAWRLGMKVINAYMTKGRQAAAYEAVCMRQQQSFGAAAEQHALLGKPVTTEAAGSSFEIPDSMDELQRGCQAPLEVSNEVVKNEKVKDEACTSNGAGSPLAACIMGVCSLLCLQLGRSWRNPRCAWNCEGGHQGA